MDYGGQRAASLSRRALLLGLGLWPGLAQAQTRPDRRKPQGPSISAARDIMAGAPLSVFLSQAPAGARLAIARPDASAQIAIVVVEIRSAVTVLPTPGLAGSYELRLIADRDGAPDILLRQPLATTEPVATLAAPDTVGHGQAMPVRGLGPNGEHDHVVMVPHDAASEADGPRFFPAENVEATLEAPERPGSYELRYVMVAPVSGPRILARRAIRVI